MKKFTIKIFKIPWSNQSVLCINGASVGVWMRRILVKFFPHYYSSDVCLRGLSNVINAYNILGFNPKGYPSKEEIEGVMKFVEDCRNKII